MAITFVTTFTNAYSISSSFCCSLDSIYFNRVSIASSNSFSSFGSFVVSVVSGKNKSFNSLITFFKSCVTFLSLFSSSRFSSLSSFIFSVASVALAA
jgi:hypothetical protein